MQHAKYKTDNRKLLYDAAPCGFGNGAGAPGGESAFWPCNVSSPYQVWPVPRAALVHQTNDVNEQWDLNNLASRLRIPREILDRPRSALIGNLIAY